MFLRTWFRQPWAFPAFLIFVTLLAYGPVYHAGFIWDDDGHVTPLGLRSLSGLARIWFEPGAAQQYYPLTHTLFWLQHLLWGGQPAGYHVLNLVLHAGCAVLVFYVLRRLEVRAAWLGGLLFALHPVQVETAAWVSELKNTASGVFYLTAVLVYLDYDQERSRRSYVRALLLFAAGVLCKTVVATLPAALLVVFWWKRGHLRWWRDVKPLVPFFALGLISGLFTAWVEHRYIGAAGAEFELGWIERVLVACRALGFYLGKLIWPAELVFIYPRWTPDAAAGWQYVWPAAVAAVAGGLAWLAWRRGLRGPLAALLFFAGTLFPALGFASIYPFRYSFVADHFQYLAAIGPIALAAGGFSMVRRRWRIGARVGCVVLVGVLAAATWSRCEAFRSMRALWEDTVRGNPECWMAYSNLSVLSLSEGRVDEAVAEARRALELKPAGYREAWVNLGNALFRKGDTAGAVDAYRKAIEIEPAYALAWNNLGALLLGTGRLEESVACLEQALRLRGDLGEAECNLGEALARMGRPGDAIVHYERALNSDPGYAAAHTGLAEVLAGQGKVAEAERHYQSAVAQEPPSARALNGLGDLLLSQGRAREAVDPYRAAIPAAPFDPRPHFNLGRALSRLGRWPEAVEQWKLARERAPQNPSASNELAWLMATCPDAGMRDGPKALQFAKEAVELSSGGDPLVLDTLGAAQAECGQFADAQATLRGAVALAERQGRTDVLPELRQRLALYAEGRPYRERAVEPGP